MKDKQIDQVLKALQTKSRINFTMFPFISQYHRVISDLKNKGHKIVSIGMAPLSPNSDTKVMWHRLEVSK